VIQPFLDENWQVDYYLINKDLTINIDSIYEKINEFSPTVLYVHSYFGFNTLLNCENELDNIKNAGMTIVEDITQCLFSNHHLRCADGGVLISTEALPTNYEVEADWKIDAIAKQAYRMKARYFVSNNPYDKDLFRKKYFELNEKISDNKSISDISSLSRTIFEKCTIADISVKRINNYNILFDYLSDCNVVRPILGKCSVTETPLYLPVYTTERNQLQKYFANNNVYCPIIWPKFEKLEAVNEEVQYMYENMLCFPIDQRYGKEEMDCIIDLLHKYSLDKANR
jgi:hypothetical protein